MGKISYMPTRLEMDESVSDKAKIFYMKILRLSNNDDEFCYATNEYFMKIMKCGKDLIIDMLKELEKGEYIKILYANKNNRSGRKIYAKIDIDFVSAETDTDSFVSATADTPCRQNPTRQPIIYNKFNIKENLKRKNQNFDDVICDELSKSKNENLDKFLDAKSKKQNQVRVQILNIALPSQINPQMWAEFVQMRSEIKKPLTQTAASRIIKRLESFIAQGYDANEILDRSIRNSWQDVFEPIKTANVGGVKANADADDARIRAVVMDDEFDVIDAAKNGIKTLVDGRRVAYGSYQGKTRFYFLD
ncbi:helix-turn-helix domain-containing protein [Campylobacter sp. 7477a]|uniref:helix-turn-helix domain-containing protein n=1 Tax=Campylobacter sp. 7477a TaxID=2735741 RepID=UPI0030147030|nr:helix-turn-helix domain-containing protein [Campylobacter sp. 7477a]